MTDTATGLMWKQCPEGTLFPGGGALLRSGHQPYPLLEYAVYPEYIVSTWSSSPYANYSDLAWFVVFVNGVVGNDYRDDGYAVRLVRGGQ